MSKFVILIQNFKQMWKNTKWKIHLNIWMLKKFFKCGVFEITLLYILSRHCTSMVAFLFILRNQWSPWRTLPFHSFMLLWSITLMWCHDLKWCSSRKSLFSKTVYWGLVCSQPLLLTQQNNELNILTFHFSSKYLTSYW